MTPEAFTYYTEHEKELRALVACCLKGVQPERIDAIMSDVILQRLPRLLSDYNPERGALRTYLYGSLRWYVVKFLKSEDQHRHRFNSSEHVADNEGYTEDYDAKLDAEHFDHRLRSFLSRDQYRILHRRHCQGLLMKEIAAKMGVGKVTCWLRYREAMEAARKMREPER